MHVESEFEFYGALPGPVDEKTIVREFDERATVTEPRRAGADERAEVEPPLFRSDDDRPNAAGAGGVGKR